MDKTEAGFQAMVARLQSVNAEVRIHLSGGSVAKSPGRAIRWTPGEDLMQIGEFTYIDIKSIIRVDIQHL